MEVVSAVAVVPQRYLLPSTAVWLEAIILLALYLYQLTETESRRIKEGGYVSTILTLVFIFLHPTWSPVATFARLSFTRVVYCFLKVTSLQISNPELKFRRITRHIQYMFQILGYFVVLGIAAFLLIDII